MIEEIRKVFEQEPKVFLFTSEIRDKLEQKTTNEKILKEISKNGGEHGIYIDCETCSNPVIFTSIKKTKKDKQ